MTAQTDLTKIKKIVDDTDEHRNRARREAWDKIKEILGLSEPEPEPEPEPTSVVPEPEVVPAPAATEPAVAETPAKATSGT